MSAQVASVVAVAGLALLAASCGGSPGSHVAQVVSTGPQTGTSALRAPEQGSGAIAFSRCMRSHAVPAYPDPGTGGLLPKKTAQQLGVSNAVFQAAQGACVHLVPNGGQPTSAQVQQYESVMLKYARCLRAHGVSNMPDPDSHGHLDIGPGTNVDVNSPKFEAAYRACKPDLSP